MAKYYGHMNQEGCWALPAETPLSSHRHQAPVNPICTAIGYNKQMITVLVSGGFDDLLLQVKLSDGLLSHLVLHVLACHRHRERLLEHHILRNLSTCATSWYHDQFSSRQALSEYLVVCDFVLAEGLNVFSGHHLRAGAVLLLDPRAHLLTVLRAGKVKEVNTKVIVRGGGATNLPVGHANDLHVLDGRVGVEEFLDLTRVHVLPAPDDHILAPAHDLAEAVLVEH
jgi:hypothetical protein